MGEARAGIGSVTGGREARAQRRARHVAKLGGTMLLVLAATLPARRAGADDAPSADFRVRVLTVLDLERQRPANARAAIEGSLDDPHPAVRSASAAALAALGDTAAMAALERRLVVETSASVRAQLDMSLDTLRRIATSPKTTLPRGARFVLQLGGMRGAPVTAATTAAAPAAPAAAGTPSPERLAEIMRSAAKAGAAAVPGAVVVDGVDTAIAKQAAERKIPVFILDGVLHPFAATTQEDGGTTLRVEVEFSVRRLPDQVLKGTLAGSASMPDADAMMTPAYLAQLQTQLVSGAVQSALRGADRGLTLALR